MISLWGGKYSNCTNNLYVKYWWIKNSLNKHRKDFSKRKWTNLRFSRNENQELKRRPCSYVVVKNKYNQQPSVVKGNILLNNILLIESFFYYRLKKFISCLSSRSSQEIITLSFISLAPIFANEGIILFLKVSGNWISILHSLLSRVKYVVPVCCSTTL